MKNFVMIMVIWVMGAQAVSAQTVYITATGDKYHTSHCHHIKKSGKPTTLREAKALNYTACKVCHPKRSSAPVRKYNNSAGGHAKQCSGTTKSGNRCRRMTKSANGRCYQH